MLELSDRVWSLVGADAAPARFRETLGLGPTTVTVLARSSLTPPDVRRFALSTLAPPAPSSPTEVPVPVPAITETRPRRTLLGFVGTRRTVEIILTLILGVGGGLL